MKLIILLYELESDISKRLMQQGCVKIGLTRCPIYEHFAVVRCFNWGIYGHFARECRRETCLKCSDKYYSNVKYVNCGYANEKLGFKLETEHAANVT